METHTLIIGGTGMLKEASIALAASTAALSSVARTRGSLRTLDDAVQGFSAKHYLLQLDWLDRRDFLDSLSNHIQRIGIPSLVIAWLHEDDLGLEVARLCSSATQPCRFFQVRGSSAASPDSGAESFAQQFGALPGIVFHQIILGFVRSPTGSRWLHNAEISSGVLRAVKTAQQLSIVGEVAPWDARP